MPRWTRSAQRSAQNDAAGFSAVVRFARPGDSHAKALKAGEIAVIDAADLDRAQAEELVDRKVRAVVNAKASSSGRFPNLGPRVLADAGVTLIDDVGDGIWSRLKSGDKVRVEGNRIFKEGVLVAQGVAQDDASVTHQLGLAEQGLTTRLESLTANASDHLERERAMLLEGARVPRLSRKLRGRPAVVVQKAHDWRPDLKSLRKWIRDHDAVVIGVGAGADAAMELGLKPAVVVGGVDELSDRALRSGADVVITTSAPTHGGHERFEKAGVDVMTFVATGAPGDLAILLADSNEAPVIVEVGGAPNLVAFLERGSAEVASTFVTRLRAGRRLVDAKAVSHLVAPPMSLWPVLLVLLAGIVAVVAAIGTTPMGQDWWNDLSAQLTDARSWIEGLLP